MTNDEMTLHLLRAIAASMVCEKCGGTGTYAKYSPEYKPGEVIYFDKGESVPAYFGQVPCTCRTAIKDLLKKGYV